MRLNVPLVVVVREREGSSGAVALGITREVMQGGRALPKACEYVREWKPGQTDHSSRKSSPPKLVRYFPREQSGAYGSPVPALLCSSLKAAAEVFAWCEGYEKCAHCGDPFVPTRKDQKCCDKKNHAVLYRMSEKRKRDSRKATFRARTP
jgi:NADH pyrophosphatase NudC (nudix superfamily)